MPRTLRAGGEGAEKLWTAANFGGDKSKLAAARPPVIKKEKARPSLTSRLGDVFLHRVHLEALDRALVAVAAFLDAAERRFRHRDGVGVDAHHARLQRVADRG